MASFWKGLVAKIGKMVLDIAKSNMERYLQMYSAELIGDVIKIIQTGIIGQVGNALPNEQKRATVIEMAKAAAANHGKQIADFVLSDLFSTAFSDLKLTGKIPSSPEDLKPK